MKQIQRVAAYNVVVDADDRILLCRLSSITEAPGTWTLPGGGVEFGEHPEHAALRELHEETGLVGRIVELLAVDSYQRIARDDEGNEHDYHAIRVLYRTEIDDADLVFESNGSTDLAAWCARDTLSTMAIVETARLGIRLAYADDA